MVWLGDYRTSLKPSYVATSSLKTRYTLKKISRGFCAVHSTDYTELEEPQKPSENES